MDRYALGVLIPVLGTFFTGLIVLSFTRLGRAIAKRIEGQGDGDILARVEALELELGRTRQELAEAEERVDFTERQLARLAETRQLPPGS